MKKSGKRPPSTDGKKKKKVTKKKAQLAPSLFGDHKYEDPKLVTPKIEITIILSNPPSPLFSKK
jgi:hypothetical protein